MVVYKTPSAQIYIFILLFAFAAISESTFFHMMMMHKPACKSNCCKSKKCPMTKCHPGQMMKPHAGWCGCCPKCMTQLKEGDHCKPKPKHPCPHMPSSECGCGMKCKHGKCCKG